VSFFYRKSISHLQNAVNQEDKIIKNKYLVNNTKSVIRGFYRVTVEEAGIPGCYPYSWIIYSPSFGETYGLLLSQIWRKKRYDPSKRRDTITQTGVLTTQWPTSSRKQV